MTATRWNPLRANMAAMGLVPTAQVTVNPEASESLKQSIRDDPAARLAESWAVPEGTVAVRRLCPGTGIDFDDCTCEHC